MKANAGSSARRATVVGRSLGGLFAALLLDRAGWDVDVYERSPRDLESRGGGIVLQPQVVEVFRRVGLDPQGPVGVVAEERVFFSKDGSVLTRSRVPQKQTSWSAIYNALKGALPANRYHSGMELVGIEQDALTATACFATGERVTSDLLVAADGGLSTVRRLLLPSVEPQYAGYVAWRGLVPEADVDVETADALRDRFSFFEMPSSHMLNYLVAGDAQSTKPGTRLLNWVWYRNAVEEAEIALALTDRDGQRRVMGVPPGKLSADAELDLRLAADRLLPEPFRRLVRATKEPFAQAIVDLAVSRMAIGRVALVGDAAFVPRPHTAASTAKAAANALALVESLDETSDDVEQALKHWEPAQLELGEHLRAAGKALGDRSQFPFGRPTPRRQT
jgi:2-polyprenyl-6-methoxyphenol hydroxylase-like FAD-dependent oxidoreductase